MVVTLREWAHKSLQEEEERPDSFLERFRGPELQIAPSRISINRPDHDGNNSAKTKWVCRLTTLTSLWTVAVWSTLQSSEHQNDQTQEQFLPSGSPSHEHLTLNVEHITLFTLFIHHTYIFFISICTYQTCTHIIVYIIYCVFAILYIAYLYIILLLSVSCPVAVILLHCVTELLSL